MAADHASAAAAIGPDFRCERLQRFEALLHEELARLQARLASEFKDALALGGTGAAHARSGAPGTSSGNEGGALSWLFCSAGKQRPDAALLQAPDEMVQQDGSQASKEPEAGGEKGGQDLAEVADVILSHDIAPSVRDSKEAIADGETCSDREAIWGRLGVETLRKWRQHHQSASLNGAGESNALGNLCGLIGEGGGEESSSDGEWLWCTHAEWLQVYSEAGLKRTATSGFAAGTGAPNTSHADALCGAEVRGKAGMLRYLVVHPDSHLRLLWGAWGALLLFLDVFFMPLELARLLPANNILQGFSVICAAYWAFDIPFSALTGYHRCTHIEMRPRRVIGHYAKSWLLVDLPLVVADVCFIALEMGNSSVRAIRLFRLFRLLRLLRLYKATRAVESLMSATLSQRLYILYRLIRLVFIVLVLNHYVACSFYGVGVWSEQGSWVSRWNPDPDDHFFSYVLAFHWSVTQCTLATNDIAPISEHERIWAVFVCLCALVVFSLFISTVTNVVAELRQRSLARLQERNNLLTFIQQKKVTVSLTNGILNFVDVHSHQQIPMLTESEVPALRALPESLRVQLHNEVNGSFVQQNALFRKVVALDESFWLQVSHVCFRDHRYLSQQDLFLDGVNSIGAYVLTHGVLRYKQQKCPPHLLESGEWLSEGTIWTECWVHLGTLVAVRTSNVLVLDCEKFRKLAATSYTIHRVLRVCAILYCHSLEANMTDPSDLSLDFGMEEGEGNIEMIAERALKFTNCAQKVCLTQVDSSISGLENILSFQGFHKSWSSISGFSWLSRLGIHRSKTTLRPC